MNDGLERILALILDKLNSNATVTSGLLSMRGQIVFAVKSGLDGKLDAMRNVYNSLIDETDGNNLIILQQTSEIILYYAHLLFPYIDAWRVCTDGVLHDYSLYKAKFSIKLSSI